MSFSYLSISGGDILILFFLLSVIFQPRSSACQFMSTGSIFGPVDRVNPYYLFSIIPTLNPFVKHVTAIHWNFKNIVCIFSSSHIM